MVWILILLLFVLIGAAYAILWHWAPKAKNEKLHAACSAAQGLAAVTTAVAIVFAGSLYIFEKQWSPRFSVAISADAHPNPNSPTNQPTAILQTVLTITNQSRTSQVVGGYSVGVMGVRALSTSNADQHGDLPAEVIQNFVTKRTKEIGVGETDLGYVETVVPCEWKVVRLIVKVPQPPFNIDTPPDKRFVYQRKALVSTEKGCPSNSVALNE